MGNADRKADRAKKTEAYRGLVRALRGISDVYRATPSSIFDCLSKARLSEKHAVSSILSRAELLREDSGFSVPEELSDQAVATHFAQAAVLYGTAGTDCVLTQDLPRSFKYFRKAAQMARTAAELHLPCDAELQRKSREYLEKAAMVRQESARRSVLRKRLSLGFLKRRR